MIFASILLNFRLFLKMVVSYLQAITSRPCEKRALKTAAKCSVKNKNTPPGSFRNCCKDSGALFLFSGMKRKFSPFLQPAVFGYLLSAQKVQHRLVSNSDLNNLPRKTTLPARLALGAARAGCGSFPADRAPVHRALHHFERR